MHKNESAQTFGQKTVQTLSQMDNRELHKELTTYMNLANAQTEKFFSLGDTALAIPLQKEFNKVHQIQNELIYEENKKITIQNIIIPIIEISFHQVVLY